MTKKLVTHGQKIGKSFAKKLVTHDQNFSHDKLMAKILVNSWPKNW